MPIRALRCALARDLLLAPLSTPCPRLLVTEHQNLICKTTNVAMKIEDIIRIHKVRRLRSWWWRFGTEARHMMAIHIIIIYTIYIWHRYHLLDESAPGQKNGHGSCGHRKNRAPIGKADGIQAAPKTKSSTACGYGSIPIDTFLVGWTSIYQLFWGSLGTRVLTHPHVTAWWHVLKVGQMQFCRETMTTHRTWLGRLCQEAENDLKPFWIHAKE